MKKFLKEFRDFAMKGSIIELAVAVIIASAFKPVISTLVDNIIMPPIGMLLGNVDFKELSFVIQESTTKGGEVIPEVSIGYGMFIQTIIDFIIIAFCIFLVIKAYNKMQKKKEEEPSTPPAPSNQEILLTEIRDALKNK